MINVPSRIRDYEVVFADAPALQRELTFAGPSATVVDERVWELYSDRLLSFLDAATVIVLPIREELKTMRSVEFLWDSLTVHQARKNLTLVSIGGGICQDVTGFAASTLYRGIPWVFVPTTLLAQADSCIGAKTSLNYRSFKNLVGTFYPPTRVVVHTPFLNTQEDPDFFSGLGEVAKLHVIGGDAATAELVSTRDELISRDPAALTRAVSASLEIKRSFIAEDEFDRGRRNLLNFGHCFGHALETASNYAIPHGQAVVAGMLLAGICARNRGLLSPERESFVTRELLLPILVVRPRRDQLLPGPVIDAMGQDKKRTGAGLALVMLTDAGMSMVSDLSAAEAAAALEEAARLPGLA